MDRTLACCNLPMRPQPYARTRGYFGRWRCCSLCLSCVTRSRDGVWLVYVAQINGMGVLAKTTEGSCGSIGTTLLAILVMEWSREARSNAVLLWSEHHTDFKLLHCVGGAAEAERLMPGGEDEAQLGRFFENDICHFTLRTPLR